MTKILVPALLILGLIIGVYLVSQRTGFFSRADIGVAPQEIKVTNISDSSFTVSWVTGKPTTGFIRYGSEGLPESALDDRDTGGQQFRTTHHVTLKNLEPEKTYYYQITSGAESFDDKGKPFQQTTAPVTENPPAPPEPIFGKVVKQDGSIPAEVLVYLDINGGSPLSGYIREDGNWLITLNNARTKDLSNYMTVKEDDKVNLVVNATTEGMAKAQGRAGEKGNFSKISLVAPAASDNKFRDLNGDGVINIFDYILYYLK